MRLRYVVALLAVVGIAAILMIAVATRTCPTPSAPPEAQDDVAMIKKPESGDRLVLAPGPIEVVTSRGEKFTCDSLEWDQDIESHYACVQGSRYFRFMESDRITRPITTNWRKR